MSQYTYSLLIAFWLASCAVAPAILKPNPLALEIIRPRPGHEGRLTNQTCIEVQKEACTKWLIREYDINDPKLRAELNQIGFICKIGKERFKICKDKAGFCQVSYKKCGLFGLSSCEYEKSFIPITPYQFILDADTRCFQQDQYSFLEM